MSRLELIKLSLRRHGRACVENISVTVAPGQIMAVVGPNGAGKSTLLKLASGEWAASEGQVRLRGKELSEWPLRERARHMAVLPQQASLSFPFRAGEVVALGRMPHATGHVHDACCVDEALHMFELSALRDAPYTSLSGGERQRVQLARVLAQLWPQSNESCEGILLLDEPTAALDWAHQLRLLHELRGLAARGMSILLVLHDLNLALRFADQVALLHQGKLVACGSPQDVLTPQHIAQVFAVDVVMQAHPRDGHAVIIP